SPAFLPLLASLFPTLLTRLLADPTPYVQLSATTCLTTAIEHAGDFLGSRIQDAWPEICTLYRRVEKEMHLETRQFGTTTSHRSLTPQTGGRGRGRNTGMKYKMWDALLTFFLGITCHIGLEKGDMEDEMFELLAPCLGSHGVQSQRREEVKRCLGTWNADAVWLVEMREGGRMEEEGRGMGEGERMQMAKKPNVPRWQFADLDV
ncbi:MAG: hypothetical protein Q9190_002098, partial [Brigantiaea leucoxantha]